eukprot:353394-Chlamydomonas_euryale.AAC.4
MGGEGGVGEKECGGDWRRLTVSEEGQMDRSLIAIWLACHVRSAFRSTGYYEEEEVEVEEVKRMLQEPPSTPTRCVRAQEEPGSCRVSLERLQ